MKHVFGIFCTAVGLAAVLGAQTQDPAAKSAEARGSESVVTLTGCLKDEGNDRFSLTEEGAAAVPAGKTYRLLPSGGVDLKSHVGHKVEVKGTKAAKEPTEKGVAEDPSGLKVTAVKMVSQTCGAMK
jgi:hypothetical protein